MDLFFGFVLLLLAGGMVALFAMVGELASRVGDPASPAPPSTQVEPVEDARIGHVPDVWPGGLEVIGTADTAVLLVLSTVCASCQTVAQQLAQRPDITADRPWGVVVTCGDVARGEEFVTRYGLGPLPHLLDVNGDWVRAEFNVESSPVAVLFAHSTVAATLLFNDVAALNAASARALGGHRHEEVAP
ncbi:hypothetical protein GCM10009557_09770 [Virgisporangium ochraceum]|uniref:Thioredoxin domain-containing protein n=1 Tax=Virgisporangium ochraceum TaxID=65505 RepID=A0A8J3ZVY9_9ACTN|nr:hypothetical protein [Virgisporangium ochraceum]GIJ71374.1 hypothetical protein Voc01_062910 [Virgisporangium ochraceum]